MQQESPSNHRSDTNDEGSEETVVVHVRSPGDHVAPFGWWAFSTLRVGNALAWARRPAGKRLAEASEDAKHHPWAARDQPGT